MHLICSSATILNFCCCTIIGGFTVHISVSQVVSHLLRSSPVHHPAPGPSHNSAPQTSQDPPRCPARDLFLHHYRLAQLSHGEVWILDKTGIPDRSCDGTQAQGGWLEVGTETLAVSVCVISLGSLSYIPIVLFCCSEEMSQNIDEPKLLKKWCHCSLLHVTV